jgi:hypothetical protein
MPVLGRRGRNISSLRPATQGDSISKNSINRELNTYTKNKKKF